MRSDLKYHKKYLIKYCKITKTKVEILMIVSNFHSQLVLKTFYRI